MTISRSSVKRMLTADMKSLVDEAEAALAAGIAGGCTVIGNDRLIWIARRESKSHLDCVQISSGKRRQYVISEAALDYMRGRKLPKTTVSLLQNHLQRCFH